LLKKKDEARQL
jgi:hypothetical protein